MKSSFFITLAHENTKINVIITRKQINHIDKHENM